MAMRITTKMMQNTSLRNLNINKARQEMLTNQMSTGKNITRPSDDPVIAIRALKLNSPNAHRRHDKPVFQGHTANLTFCK